MYPQRSVMTCGLATALEPPHFNHAPVRGATRSSQSGKLCASVSIHAPAWGATSWRPDTHAERHCFNPRTRVGCDGRTWPSCPRPRRFQSTHPRGVRRAAGLRVAHPGGVSIHAPAWGATCAFYYMDGGSIQFQSTHPRGVRPENIDYRSIFYMFQSTHPRGVRHAPPGADHRPRPFQSTHPRGVRLADLKLVRDGTLFQSTHPRGVRPRGMGRDCDD